MSAPDPSRSGHARAVLLTAATAVALLTGCAEKPQTNTGAKPDVPAWQGTAKGGNPAPGFKPGDATSWNEQMRQRGQNQNEYTRAAGRS